MRVGSWGQAGCLLLLIAACVVAYFAYFGSLALSHAAGRPSSHATPPDLPKLQGPFKVTTAYATWRFVGASDILERTFKFSVSNQTGYAIESFRVRFTITVPGRSVPWAAPEFDVHVPNGLEPGESKDFEEVATMIPTDIGEVPKDAVWEFKILKLKGPHLDF